MAPTAMKSPVFMSAIFAGSAPNIWALSASFTVTSSPLLGLRTNDVPVTLPTVPLARTVGGCCASAVVVTHATSKTMPVSLLFMFMSFSKSRAYFVLHRRRGAIATDIDAGCHEGIVGHFLRRENDHLRARLEIAGGSRRECNDRRVGGNDDLFLAVRIFDHDDLAVDAGNC